MSSSRWRDDKSPCGLTRRTALRASRIELTARLGARHMVLHCGMAADSRPDALEAAYGRHMALEDLSRYLYRMMMAWSRRTGIPQTPVGRGPQEILLW